MKRLVVNADDFGMSPSVNAGIIRAYRHGIVTSASLLANGASFAEAVQLAKAHPSLGVGVHLNVTEGGPVMPASRVASLVSRAGCFSGTAWAFAARYCLGRIDTNELRTELTAQIQRVFDAGLRPTHVDSHMHMHCLPRVRNAALAAASRFGIRRMRCACEISLTRRLPTALSRASRARSALVGYLAATARGELARGAMRTTDHFLGPQLMGRLDAATLARVIELLPDGVTELMCHPALDPGTAAHIHRDRELAALTSRAVRAAIRERSVELVSFAQL